MEQNYLWCYSRKPRKGLLEDDFYFYSDGRILRVYDRTINKLNLEEWVTKDFFLKEEIADIIKRCPNEYKNHTKNVLLF